MFDIEQNIPIYTVFILVLIISANFLAQLFPCRVQEALNNNMLLKHFFGYLTLIFFVTLSSPLKDKKIEKIIIQSFFLYFMFLLYSKTDLKIFILVFILLFIIYCLVLKKNEYEADSVNLENNKEKIENIITIINILTYISIILIIIGILSYLGQKKYEYKNDFSYIKFFFGKPSCKGNSPKLTFMNSFKHII